MKIVHHSPKQPLTCGCIDSLVLERAKVDSTNIYPMLSSSKDSCQPWILKYLCVGPNIYCTSPACLLCSSKSFVCFVFKNFRDCNCKKLAQQYGNVSHVPSCCFIKNNVQVCKWRNTSSAGTILMEPPHWWSCWHLEFLWEWEVFLEFLMVHYYKNVVWSLGPSSLFLVAISEYLGWCRAFRRNLNCALKYLWKVMKKNH